jgi:hypothetical protein
MTMKLRRFVPVAIVGILLAGILSDPFIVVTPASGDLGKT